MVMYAGLVVFCFLGFVAAGEEPVAPNQFQVQSSPQWGPGVTTVCIQIRGPHGQAICGPVISKEDEKGIAGRNADPIQQGQHQIGQSNGWVSEAQLNPSIPLRSAVLQGFIGNGPVYQMGPGRAMETLPPLVKVNNFGPSSPMAMVRAPEFQQSSPFTEQAMRVNGPPQQLMMAPPHEMPPHFQTGGPQLRTFPFAPFGIESSAAPQQQQFQMRQALRAANPEFMPAMRAADCPENFQQPPAQMVRSSASDTLESQNEEKDLSKQCEEQEKEIKLKKDEIANLKKQLEKLAESAKTSSMTVEQKTITTKSSQGQSDVRTEKEFEEMKQKSEIPEKKKKK